MKNFTLLYLLFFTCISSTLSQNIEIYVSDGGNFSIPPWQILKFDENGDNPEVFINTNLAWPQDILFLEDQNVVLISNLNSGTIAKFDSSTGAFVGNFASGIGGPTRMKIGPDGLLYVLQWSGNGRVLRYELDGTFLGAFTSTGVTNSIGLDWDNAGNLYVSSYSTDNIRRYNSSGTDMGNFVNSNLVGPTNIVFDDAGNLIVLDYDGDTVKRFDANGNYLGVFISGVDQSEGIDFMPNGDILIGNGGTSAVKRYTSSGVFIEDFVASGSGNLLLPNAVRIRDLSLSVPDFEFEENTVFLKSNVGNKFIIKSDVQSNRASKKVYNIFGALIEQGEITTSLVWDAESASEGLYFIKIELDNGRQLTQKVVVVN
ncbi:T9SS type A sorting domain-containing protein [Winogradskyella sp. 3972H.M.0a.05]|uniref:T9SS type A sorting domain-containing protein n=1 Tax=Winogradskyella sp. 3972H.M.0a.05 TaxID=2950277 RepID=UPI0033922645